jgi:hypothetical protein
MAKYNPRQTNMNALAAALQQLGGGLIAGGGPSTDPGYSQRMFGQGIANAGTAFQNTQDNALKGRMTTMKLQEMERAAAVSAARDKQWANLFPASSGSAPAQTEGLIAPQAGVDYGRAMGSPAATEQLRAMAPGPTPQAAIRQDAAQQTPQGPQGLEGLLANLTPELQALLPTLGPEEGMKLLVSQASKERRIVKGADGYNYYEDGSRVLPNAAKEAERKQFTINQGDEQVTYAGDPLDPATWQEQSRAPRNRPTTTVNNDMSGTAATVEKIRELRASGTPQDTQIADKLEMRMIFGGNPPEPYIKAARAIDRTREGISAAYELVKNGTGAINPADRAKLKQAFNQAILGYAELTNRGANFTESEQDMINSVLGGSPSDALQRALRGDASYLEAFKIAGAAIEREARGLLETYTKPRGGAGYQYPWEGETPKAGQPMKIQSDADYNALQSGAEFIGPDGVKRRKP